MPNWPTVAERHGRHVLFVTRRSVTSALNCELILMYIGSNMCTICVNMIVFKPNNCILAINALKRMKTHKRDPPLNCRFTETWIYKRLCLFHSLKKVVKHTRIVFYVSRISRLVMVGEMTWKNTKKIHGAILKLKKTSKALSLKNCFTSKSTSVSDLEADTIQA